MLEIALQTHFFGAVKLRFRMAAGEVYLVLGSNRTSCIPVRLAINATQCAKALEYWLIAAVVVGAGAIWLSLPGDLLAALWHLHCSL